VTVEPDDASPAEVLRLTGLTRAFGEVLAVDGIDLEVRAGEFFGFLGPNGAGKTTTIRMATGLLRPSSGEVRVLGLDPYRKPLEVKARIGVVPEEAPLYERLTGRESLELAARLHLLDGGTARRHADAILTWLDLQESASRMIVDYSQGMRKKIALGCAMIHKPRLLFLDEPFSGIDPIGAKAIKDVLGTMVAGGATVFFSSHVMELVERLCTRVAIIHRGRIRAVGSLVELRQRAGLGNDATLEQVFIDLVGESIGDDGDVG
jgi:ABC-2 type transport system ATP-binding protein